ncbi:MAG: AI-2E family transporter [Planctomycetia bacterium]|nr:AI-2E family transporter [Planctomycetia bacterium]
MSKSQQKKSKVRQTMPKQGGNGMSKNVTTDTTQPITETFIVNAVTAEVTDISEDSLDRNTRSPLREEQFWLLTGCVLLLAFVAFSFAMYFTRSFMIPFVFAILLCAMVSPVNNLVVVRWKLPQWVGFISSLLVILFLFFLCFLVTRFAIESISREIVAVKNQAAAAAAERESFEAELTASIPELTVSTDTETGNGTEIKTENETGTEPDAKTAPKIEPETVPTGTPKSVVSTPVTNSVTPPATTDGPSKTPSTLKTFEATIDMALERFGLKSNFFNAKQITGPVREQLPSLLNSALSACKNFISSGMLVLLFCIFILMGRDPRVRQKNAIYNEIEHSIQKYLNIKFAISFATGATIYIIFTALGLKMAFLFGLITFVLNFVPSIGSIIATVLPLPILMVTMEDITNTQLILAFVLPTITQNFFGNLLEPKLQGQGLKLHEVTLLMALGFWGVVWGPVGMLLAAPLTAAMRIIMLEFKMTQGIADLMGGKLPTLQRDLDAEEAEK